MKKNKLTTIFLVFVFLVGLCLLLYPKLSNYWNSFHQSKAISHYIEAVNALDEDTCLKLFAEADAYNRSLEKRSNVFALTPAQEESYPTLLDIGGDGVMGYIDIPSIGVSLPVCHGTSHSVLQTAVGHLEWTSLPVGGVGSHCVLSGHRGLPSSKLFTDLDKLVVGDLFYISVLNETLAYRVEQILIVEPSDVSSLIAQPGKDYCTLVTCTPYGVNSHRLLVRGLREENTEDASLVHVSADALLVEPILVAPVIFVCILLSLLLMVMAISNIRKIRRRIK